MRRDLWPVAPGSEAEAQLESGHVSTLRGICANRFERRRRARAPTSCTYFGTMLPVLILMVIFGSVASIVLGVRFMKHRERMAEIEARKAEALAKAASLEALKPGRDQLAKELLAAYDEADEVTRG